MIWTHVCLVADFGGFVCLLSSIVCRKLDGLVLNNSKQNAGSFGKASAFLNYIKNLSVTHEKGIMNE